MIHKKPHNCQYMEGARTGHGRNRRVIRFSLVGCLLFVILSNLFLGHRIISQLQDVSSNNSVTNSPFAWFVSKSLASNSNSKTPSNNWRTVTPAQTLTISQSVKINLNGSNNAAQHQGKDDPSHLIQRHELVTSADASEHSEPHQIVVGTNDFAYVKTDANADTTCLSYAKRYKGVLHIAMGDIGGGASTIFFQFVMGQLIYAEQYQLLPLIHFNNVSNIIYDQVVHGTGPRVKLSFKGTGVATDIVRPNGHWRDRIPGPPKFGGSDDDDTATIIQLEGTGVWNDYFLPVVPSLDVSNQENILWAQQCARHLPYLTLTLKQITPGIHGFAPWAPKCWRYHYLPDYVTKPHWPLHEWLRPSRLLGHAAVQRYNIRFQPYIVQAAQQANPHCGNDDDNVGSNKCLGLHIRHSDKAAGRRQVPVKDFLPFVQAFVHAGGEFIYLATDSTLVIQEITDKWPVNIQRRISYLGLSRTTGEKDAPRGNEQGFVVRSSSDQAVFDIAASRHHTTNVQALVEIKALSLCRFMVHGLSALSESVLWLNQELQRSSVDLEDPDHIDPSLFGTLVQMILRGYRVNNDPANEQLHLPRPTPSSKWWKVRPDFIDGLGVQELREQPSSLFTSSLSGYNGVLLISSTGGDRVTLDMAFFTHILNQLLYAEKHHWLPWIHLEPHKEKSVLYDRWAHYGVHQASTVRRFSAQWNISMKSSGYPGAPNKYNYNGNTQQRDAVLQRDGNGMWETYLQPIPEFSQHHDDVWQHLPVATLSDPLVMALTSKAPWAVRVWKYKNVPDRLWKPANVSWKDWYAPIRQRANAIIQKYYHFRPYLLDRVDAVNPINSNDNDVCVSVHMNRGANDFRDYLQEFVKAGGSFIYLATDSWRLLQYVSKNFPSDITSKIRTQGDQVVRTTKEWPLHMIDNHHRVNSEALVDILAMSKCNFLLHTTSTPSEAAIYLNLNLHNNSVNMDDPDRISAAQFGTMVQRAVERVRNSAKAAQESITPPPPLPGPVLERKLNNATIVFRDMPRSCRTNALVYLAQKKHSSYTGRDSFASLVRSLDLIHKNYLSLNNHLDKLDLFIFHTNDFTYTDLELLEARLGPSYYGVIRLVNLTGSPFWQRPEHHVTDDPNSWYAYPLFSEGYRRMMHWFAIDVWDFFAQWNDQEGCSYRYIFRLDEDSFVHSPIPYDIFDFMQSNQYVYGYRLCAYEMQVTRRMWTLYNQQQKRRHGDFHPARNVELEMCGFYNNFFVADLEFFRSAPVQSFLHFIDRQGHIYRRRLGDLMIHSMAVYAFAPSHQIHRFLDFTYEHGTFNQTNGCLTWGGIQAGYNDENATTTLSKFYKEKLLDRGCMANATMMRPQDLSPSYAHLPQGLQDTLALYTITAGRVEFPLGKGILSG